MIRLTDPARIGPALGDMRRHAHLRAGTDACGDCLEAHAAYVRKRYRVQRGVR